MALDAAAQDLDVCAGAAVQDGEDDESYVELSCSDNSEYTEITVNDEEEEESFVEEVVEEVIEDDDDYDEYLANGVEDMKIAGQAAATQESAGGESAVPPQVVEAAAAPALAQQAAAVAPAPDPARKKYGRSAATTVTALNKPPPAFASMNKPKKGPKQKEETAAVAAATPALTDEPSEYYTLKQLQEKSVDGLDYPNREKYLSPTEFKKVFKATKEEVAGWPKWKLTNAKRKAKLW